MRSPSARKKKVENSTGQEARHHVAEGGADLADVGEQRPVLDEVVDRLLGLVQRDEREKELF